MKWNHPVRPLCHRQPVLWEARYSQACRPGSNAMAPSQLIVVLFVALHRDLNLASASKEGNMSGLMSSLGSQAWMSSRRPVPATLSHPRWRRCVRSPVPASALKPHSSVRSLTQFGSQVSVFQSHEPATLSHSSMASMSAKPCSSFDSQAMVQQWLFELIWVSDFDVL